MSRPHPFERGGAGTVAVHAAHPRVLMVEPISLNRGEGLISGLFCVVQPKLWWQEHGGGGGTRENEPKSTVMWLMLNSNSARHER